MKPIYIPLYRKLGIFLIPLMEKGSSLLNTLTLWLRELTVVSDPVPNPHEHHDPVECYWRSSIKQILYLLTFGSFFVVQDELQMEIAILSSSY